MRLSESARYYLATSFFTFTILLCGVALAVTGVNGNDKVKGGGDLQDLEGVIVLDRDVADVPVIISDFCQQSLPVASAEITNGGTVECKPSSADEL